MLRQRVEQGLQRRRDGDSGPPAAALPGTAATLRWLFIVALLFYVLTAGSNFTSGDAYSELRVTQSLVDHGWVNVPQGQPNQLCAGWGCLGSDGRFYATHGIGYSLFLLPFYVVADATQHVLRVQGCDTWTTCVPIHLISWSSCLVAAATLAVLCSMWLELGYALRRSLLATLAVGIGTLVWPYARYGFDVSLTALLLAASVLDAARALAALETTSWTPRFFWRAGGLAALAILVRLPAATAVAGPVLYLLWQLRSAPRRRAAAAAVALLAPLVLSVLFSCWYNWARFGSWSPFADGHASNPAEALTTFPLVSLVGMVLSPGKGLLWYAPVLLLSALAVPCFFRCHPHMARLAALVVLPGLLPYLPVADWIGGAAWGPRFLVQFLPLLALPLIAVPDVLRHWWTRGLAALLWLASVLLQVVGCSVDYNLRLRAAAREGIGQQTLIWNPLHAPLVDAWQTFWYYATHLHNATVTVDKAQSFDVWWLNLWRNDGQSPLWTMAAAALLTALWLGALARLALAARGARRIDP